MSAHDFFGQDVPDIDYLISQLYDLENTIEGYDISKSNYAMQLRVFKAEKIKEVQTILKSIFDICDQIENYQVYVTRE